MIGHPVKFVLCNRAYSRSSKGNDAKQNVLKLEYLRGKGNTRNVNLDLPNFIRRILYLPDRVLDLLEIAAYVFAADRLVKRGTRDSVEYHNWSRSFHFIIRVRDYPFWTSSEVGETLSESLEFMTGDRSFKFTFQPGHSTPPTNLFDREEFVLDPSPKYSIILFSGGLDSTAGVLEMLERTDDRLCLVSHQSQPGTKRTQNSLVDTLKKHYPGRIFHYCFDLTLRKVRAAEETQRSRAFLYSSIAFAMARALSQERIFIFENGITSINFPRREDLSNARASRTTHPKTINLVQRFFGLFDDRPFKIELPFLWKTKTEIFRSVRQSKHPELVSSTVSCSKTFQRLESSTHCGTCSQCFDRRLAAYGSESEEIDGAGIYFCDIIKEAIENGESRTTLIDYVRQAKNFASWNVDHFYQEMLSDLVDLMDRIPGFDDDNELVEKLWELCQRHGKQVEAALCRMRNIHDNLFTMPKRNTLLHLVFSEREHLKSSMHRLIKTITEKVSLAVPKMYRKKLPEDENDLNIKVNAIISANEIEIRSEHPTVSFACAKVVPDHQIPGTNLLIESKFIRRGTAPSKASEGISADLTKRPPDSHLLFLVYDPTHAIPDDAVFKSDFESKGSCTVAILR